MLRIEQNDVLVPIPSDVESAGDQAVIAYLGALPPGCTASEAQALYDQAMRDLTQRVNDAAHAAAVKRQAAVSGPNASTPPSAPGTSAPVAPHPTFATGDDDEE